MSSYTYATGDLLEERNTYFYTAYEGQPFLEAWKRDRDCVLAQLSRADGESSELPERDEPTFQCEDAVSTKELLEKLKQKLSESAELGSEAAAALEKFLQRFEVTKRVFPAYDAEMRAIDRSDYRQLALYVLAAEIFELAYARAAQLPYLNALLKIVDTLCAMRKDLAGNERDRLKALIFAERDHVESLAEKVGAPL